MCACLGPWASDELLTLCRKPPMTRRRIVVALGTIAGVLLLLAAAGVGFTIHVMRSASAGSERRQRAALERNREAFLQDQLALAALPFLARAAGADAGPVLAPRVRWMTVAQATRGLAQTVVPPVGDAPLPDPALERWHAALPEADRHLTLAPSLGDRLAGKGWLDLPSSVAEDVDLEWMARLRDFAGWDVAASSPKETLDGGLEVHASPGTDVVAWARLRLLAGLRSRSLQAAVADVDELARLCAGSDDAILVRLAAALERDVDAALARDGLGAEGRSGRRPFEADRYLRAVGAARAWTDLRASSDRDADWDSITVGRCAALRDGVELALGIRPLLRGAYQPALARLGRLLERSPECRLQHQRRAWVDPSLGGWASAAETTSFADKVLGWIAPDYPAEALLAISEQDWFKGYLGSDDPHRANP